MFAPGWPVVAAATVFTVCFIAAVAVAQRKGIACGCFGSLFTGISGPAELRRAVTLFCLVSSAGLARFLADGGQTEPVVVAVGVLTCSSLLVAVSLDRSPRPGSALRLALIGRAP